MALFSTIENKVIFFDQKGELLRKAIEKKDVIVSEIKEKFDKSTSAILVDYLGLTVEESTKLRSDLRAADVDYKIYKNTLIKRAIDGTNFKELESSLQGSSALAFSYDDVTAPARIINDAIKAYEKMHFKAGVIEGKYYDADMLKELANIPAKDVLLAKLLGSFKAPIGAFARVLNAIAEGVEEESKGEEQVEAKEDKPVTEKQVKTQEEDSIKEKKEEAKPEKVEVEQSKTKGE
jgi:large subunit ribosomal protein L10